MSPRQLPLPLAFRPAMGKADYLVTDCNRAAYQAVTHGMTRLAITGPAGAGKTHLASIWGHALGAVRLLASDLTDPTVGAIASVRAAVIEDGDQVQGPASEALLFHALNLTAAEDTALLITGRTPPGQWPVRLPDLASRLAAMPHVAISAPDDTMLSSVLGKLFADRRLTVGPDVVTFLVRRIERSFDAAQHVVDELDKMSLAGRRPITRPLAMELFDTRPDEAGDKGA